MKIAGCLYLKLQEVNFSTFIRDSSNGGSQQFPEFLVISFSGPLFVGHYTFCGKGEPGL